MKKLFYLSCVLCGAAFAVSCSAEMQEPGNSEAIGFSGAEAASPASTQTSRGSSTASGANSLSDFGVSACYAAENVSESQDIPFNYMYNLPVRLENGLYNYAPVRYWPLTGTLSFFAYAPYNGTNVVVSPATEPDPTITYTVPDAVKSQIDLLVAQPAFNLTKALHAKQPVNLRFSHVLSEIDFQAKAYDLPAAGYSIKITAIQVGSFKNKAAIRSRNGQRTFAADAVETDYTLSIAGQTLSDLLLTNAYQPISTSNGALLVWDDAIDPTDRISVTAQYTTPRTTKNLTFEKSLSEILPAGSTALLAGSRYAFKIAVSAMGDLSLTCSVEPWTQKEVTVPDFD